MIQINMPHHSQSTDNGSITLSTSNLTWSCDEAQDPVKGMKGIIKSY